MKAIAVFPACREVRLIEHPEPRLTAPDQVKLRLLEVGICGTDREICAFQYGDPPPGSEYLILGHEGLAEVVEAGPGASGLSPGDLVVPAVRWPCPQPSCAPCRAARQDFCETGAFTEHGIKGEHGFLAEFVVSRASLLTRIPPALRGSAVLLEPLTIAEKALIELRLFQARLPQGPKPREGASALVLGAGAVGILGAMALQAAGWRTWVYSRAAAPNPKSRLVESMGMRYVSSAQESLQDAARRLGPIDVIYEAAGVAELSFEALQCLGPNGVFIFTGIPPLGPAKALDMDRLMRDLVLKNQLIFGTVNAGPDAFAAAVKDLAVFEKRWPQALGLLITGRHKPEAFSDALRGGGIKDVICWTSS